MNFFERQDRARRHTALLALLFALAVVGVVASVTAIAAIAAASLGAQRQAIALPTAEWLRFHAELLVFVAGLTAATIAIASLFRTAQLGSGGGDVARSLGGRLLRRDSKKLEERRLLNIVEEMAIASGVPVPEVYLLDEEEAINAFAAGFTAANAAIAVTRGAVENLSRDELQGVIGHEFSHILNGDMRLNQRLIGVLFGILLLALIGQGLLRSLAFAGGGRRRRDQGKGVAVILLIAVGLFVVGSIGVFFGRLIQAAVARQRESLADASAVQFTRNPTGLADALKILAVGPGSYLAAAKTDEVSHMLFGKGRASLKWLWSTHPPILERIRAIEPGFQPGELEDVAARWRRRMAEAERPETAPAGRRAGAAAGGAKLPITPEVLTGIAGTVDATRLVYAAALLSSLDAGVREGAASEDEAPALVLGLLLSREEAVRAKQLDAVRASLGEAEADRVRGWGERLAGLDPGARLPVLNLAMPSLRHRAAVELDRLVDTARVLILADDRVEPFELALSRTLAAHRDEVADPRASVHGARSLADCKESVETLLRALAGVGNAAPDAARAAYDAGVARLPGSAWEAYQPLESWAEPLDRALDELRDLAPLAKGELVTAVTAVVAQDGLVSVEEAELLRAICAALHVPMPPLAG